MVSGTEWQYTGTNGGVLVYNVDLRAEPLAGFRSCQSQWRSKALRTGPGSTVTWGLSIPSAGPKG